MIMLEPYESIISIIMIENMNMFATHEHGDGNIDATNMMQMFLVGTAAL